MNINLKTKNEIIKQRLESQQLRQLTGKKLKLSNEEKKDLIEKAQKERDQYEHQHLGHYEIVYPLEDYSKYDSMLQYSLKMYEE